MNILIVDDDEHIRALLRTLLTGKGHCALTAANGEEALAVLGREPVDVIISDMMMPRMDGYRLCQAVRGDERFKDVPFIFHSTYTSPADAKLALDLGADLFLHKPASVDAVLEALRRVTGQPRAVRPRPVVAMSQAEVMQEYSDRLVAKVEEKSNEVMAAEGKFRTLVEQSITGIYILQDDRFVYVNPRMAEILGRSAEEMTSCPLYDFIVPEDRALVRENIRQRISGAVPSIRYDLRMLHQSGAVLQIEVHGSRADYHGRPAVMGMLLDVTARKQAEEALVQRARFAALGAEVGVALIQRGSLREILRHCMEALVTHLDAAFARVWTLNEAENVVELQASAGMYTHLDGPHGRVPVGQFKIGLIALERKPHLTNAVVGDPRVNNQEWAKREGMVAFAGYPLMVDDRLVGVVAMFARHSLPEATLAALDSVADGIALGIERKRVEEDRKRLTRQLGLLLASTDEGIYDRDMQGRCTFINRAAAEMLGYRPEEVLGQNMHELVHHHKADGSPYPLEECPIFRASNQGEGSRVDTEVFWRRDGTPFPVEYSSHPIREAGVITGVVVMFNDITEKKLLAAQFLRAQRMESIGALAGGIAHDLNNALAPILMSTEFLKLISKDPNPEVGRILDTIYDSAERGAGMVKQILTFARGSEGDRGVVQPKHLVQEMIDMTRHTFPQTIQIRTAVAPNVWTLLGNPTQLHQILLNLCVNARDAMPMGGILTLAADNVRLAATEGGLFPEARPGPYVVLTVTDTGTGMTPAVRARIFEAFFTTKAPDKGTGLGLSTVHNIAKDHGGFLTVDSEVGKGTTFKVYLPAQEATSATDDEAAPPALPMGKGELILVVDDEAAIRGIATQTLEAFGYRVVTAADGAQAVGVCAQHLAGLQLLITDMDLPIMDGKATIRAIRTLLPRLPIIAASGSESLSNSAVVKELGVQAFLRKPYSADELIRMVHEVLQATASS